MNFDSTQIENLLEKYRTLQLDTVFSFNTVCGEYGEYAKFITSNAVYTGFSTIDNEMKGIRPGEVVYIISPTNVGKTAIAINILRHNKGGDTIIPFFSLENNEYQIFERIIQLEKGCSSYAIESAFNNSDKKFIAECERVSREWENIINIVKRVSINDITPYIKACEELTGKRARAVVIDYIQLVKHKGTDEYSRVSDIAQQLKEVSLNLRLPVIVLSQVSRAEAQKDSGLNLYSAKGSGEIENSAQILFSLERVNNPESITLTREIIKKNQEQKISFLKLKTLKKKRGKDLKEILLTMEYPSLRLQEYQPPPPM